MDRQKFERYAQRFEDFYARDPKLYGWGVYLLLAFGYGAYLGALLLALAILGLSIAFVFSRPSAATIKLAIFALFFAGAFLRALWVRVRPPEGRPLKAADAPELFKFLEDLRQAGAPAIHQVVISPDLNAAMAQVPRLGILGWYQNHLIIGMPMAQCLSAAQLKAVLAHELGHAWGGHGRTGTWVYRVQMTWAGLAASLDTWTIIQRFVQWYSSMLAAYTRVLSRRQELEADRYSARSTSPRDAADALILTSMVGGAWMEPFWESVKAEAEQHEEALGDVFSRMVEHVRAQPALGDAGQLRRTLGESAPSTDTHPSLADRLAALGKEPRLPAKFARSAASELFGPTEAVLLDALNKEWCQKVAPAWRGLREERLKMRGELEALEAKAGQGPLDENESWQRCRLLRDLRGTDAALEPTAAYVESYPDKAGARFVLGQLLLSKGDDRGLSHLEAALQFDPEGEQPVAVAMASYLERHGRQQEAVAWWSRAEKRFEQEEGERKKLQVFHLNEAVRPPELKAEELAAIAKAVGEHPRVERAWVFRRGSKVEPKGKVEHCLVVLPKYKLFKLEKGGEDLQMLHELIAAIKTEHAMMFFSNREIGWWTRRRYNKVAGAALELKGKA